MLGVAVSYLIIIGDLMPQVIGSIFPGSKAMPFLLDRQFWVTAFMYHPPRFILIQAYNHPTVIFKTAGFVEVHFYRCTTCLGIPCVDCRRSFSDGRYYRSTRRCTLFEMARPNEILLQSSCHHLCIYMSSKCTSSNL